MKKIVSTIIFLMVQFVCAGMVFGQSGVIKDITGTVELKRAGQTAFVPAKVGDAVGKDMVVSTGFKSIALIAVGSTVITVSPLTRLTLEEISVLAASETINVNLQTGKLRVDVKPPAGTKSIMTVSNPTSTASVRGTSFELDTMNISVREGTVAYKGNKGAVMLVSAGSSSQIREDNKALDPIVKGEAELLPPLPSGVRPEFAYQGTGITSTPYSDVEVTVGY
jgi:hypothetical protein